MLSLENTYESIGQASDHGQHHVLRSAAGRMTMSPTFVSTQYLANCLVLPVQQAQAQLTTAITEAIDRPIRRSRPSTRRPVRVRAVAERAGPATADADDRQQRRRDQSFDRAGRPELHEYERSDDSAGSRNLDSRQHDSGTQLQTIGQTALQELTSSANATSSGGYVFGGINSGTAPLADYFSTGSTASSAVETAFETTFGCSPTDAAAANITASQMQSFLSGPFADLFSGSDWTSDWSSASSTNTSARDRAGPDRDDLDQRQHAPPFRTSPRPTRCSRHSAGRRSAPRRSRQSPPPRPR